MIVIKQLEHIYQIILLGVVFIIVQILMLLITQLQILNVFLYAQQIIMLILLLEQVYVYKNVLQILLNLEMLMEV